MALVFVDNRREVSGLGVICMCVVIYVCVLVLFQKMSAPVLLKDHSLKDRNVLGVVRALKERPNELPSQLARIRPSKATEALSPAEVLAEIEGLVGSAEAARDLLDFSGVLGDQAPEEVDLGVLRYALHLVILEANAKGQPRGSQLKEPEKEEDKQVPGPSGSGSSSKGGKAVPVKVGEWLLTLLGEHVEL